MRLLNQCGGLLLLLFFSLAAAAQSSTHLQELLNPIHELQADFVQTILDNNGKAVQKSQGSMALKRPGRFRWEVLRPLPQLIVADNTRIWIYDPDLQQVVIRSVANVAGQTPVLLLMNGTDNLNKDFAIRPMSSPKNWQWFSLTPKGKDGMFHTIQLGFFNSEIKEMRMEDNLGHSSVIQFQHVKINSALSASLFKFHPPANVDIIDETRTR